MSGSFVGLYDPPLQWTLGSIAILLTSGRFYVRWKYEVQIRWDDFFNAMALATLLAYFAVIGSFLGPTGAISQGEVVGLAEMLPWATLYLVKASFLCLSWVVFEVMTNFRRAWWIVTAYTFLTFWPVFLFPLWQCSGHPIFSGQECDGDVTLQYEKSMSIIAMVFHLSSECLILVLPMIWIRKIQMSKILKISAASVFAIAIVDIIMGLIRSGVYADSQREGIIESATGQEISNVLSICEPGVAVIVCALPAYRVLLPASQDSFRKRTSKMLQLQQAGANMDNGLRSRPVQRSDTELFLVREIEATSMV